MERWGDQKRWLALRILKSMQAPATTAYCLISNDLIALRIRLNGVFGIPRNIDREGGLHFKRRKGLPCQQRPKCLSVYVCVADD